MLTVQTQVLHSCTSLRPTMDFSSHETRFTMFRLCSVVIPAPQIDFLSSIQVTWQRCSLNLPGKIHIVPTLTFSHWKHGSLGML